MKMPFGKYKGLELEEIINEDPGYWVWLSGLDNIKGPLKSELIRLNKLKNTKSVIEMYETDQHEMNEMYYIDPHDFGDHD
jgi:uncharacterized protein (DUF3820 family)